MNQLIYVETSIPSFYYETRPEPKNQARRSWTRDWWELAKWQDELVSSLWVIRELESTSEPKRSECIELLSDLRLLQSAPEIDALVECYIENKVMPADADGDARHLAVATFWKCDVLASWNCLTSFALRVVLRTSYLASLGCKHIANANKTDHIRRVNAKLSYETPTLTTPLELLGEEP